MIPTTLLFDLDDTLIADDTAMSAALLATSSPALERYGIDPQALSARVRYHAQNLWSAAPTSNYCRAIGISSTEGLWAHFLGEGPDLQALCTWAPIYRRAAWAAALADQGLSDDLRFAEQLAETFLIERRKRHWTFPETETVLQTLKGRYQLGMITNGAPDLQREKLQGTGIPDYFTTIIVSGELGIGKPDPRIFTHALAQFNSEPQQAVMIGNDLNRDVKGAQGAGIAAIWINRLGPDHTSGDIRPDAEIESLTELLDMWARN